MSNSIPKALPVVLLIVGASFVAIYLLIACLRIRYPFELEWLEGGHVDHVIRILQGHKLYESPTLEFVPYNYAPLYFYVSAAVAKIVGVGFFPLRLVSLISSLGCFLIIFVFVKTETGKAWLGFIAMSLFAATYRIGGAWLDLARIDSLYLLFFLWAFYLIRFGRSRAASVAAAVLVCLSFLTKQIALPLLIPVMFYSLIVKNRFRFLFAGLAIALVALSIIILNSIYDGWFAYYVIGIPQRRPWLRAPLIFFWTRDILLPMGISCLAGFYYLASEYQKPEKRNFIFYSLASIGLIGGSWISRLKHGAWDNNVIPAYVLLSILLALGLNTALESIKDSVPARRKILGPLVLIACIIQFLGLTYNPARQIPTTRDLEAGQKLIADISQIPGDLLFFYHGYLPSLAGKAMHAQQMAVYDVVSDSGSSASGILWKQLDEAITNKQFTSIVLDTRVPVDKTERLMAQFYTRSQEIFDDPNVFWPVTGAQTRPQFICLPK